MGDPVWKAPDAAIDEEAAPVLVTGDASAAEDSRPLGAPPWRRFAVSAAVPIAVWLMGQLTIPGLDPDRVESLYGFSGSRTATSVAALGVQPYLAAFVLIEIFALLIPAWRARRTGGIEARADLRAAAVVLAIALTILQSWMMASNYANNNFFVSPGPGAYLTTIASLTIATVMIAQLAAIVDKHGLGNGFSILLLTAFLEPLAGLSERSSILFDNNDSAGASMRLGLIAVALTALMTWAVLTNRTTLSRRGPAPDVYIPIPASGMFPVYFATTALFAAVTFLPDAELEPGFELPAPGTVQYGVALAIIATVVSIPLAWLFNHPARVAAAVERFGVDRESSTALAHESARELGKAITTTAIFTLLLVVAGHFAGAIVLSVTSVCVATAIVTDLAAEWTARRRDPDLAVVRPEHRPYAVAAILTTLREAGIPALARGRHHRTMLQFFGPYVPIDIMVPARSLADARRALLID